MMTTRINSARTVRHVGKAAIISALTLAVWLPSSAQSPAQNVALQNFLQYPDAALQGTLAARISTSIQQCALACGRRAACEGFDHDAVTSQCQLFTSVNSAETKAGSIAGTRDRVPSFRDPVNLPRAKEEQAIPVANGPSSAWTHNGSSMRMLQSPMVDGGIQVEIIYDRPRDSLRGSGIEAGSILFVGQLNGGHLSGRARLTSRRCGVIEYDVSGSFDNAAREPFTLTGPAPRRDKSCGIETWISTGPNANMRFEPN